MPASWASIAGETGSSIAASMRWITDASFGCRTPIRVGIDSRCSSRSERIAVWIIWSATRFASSTPCRRAISASIKSVEAAPPAAVKRSRSMT